MYKDFPKDEIVRGAEGAIRRYAAAGMEAHAHFKATCPKCNARPMFAEPDTIFDTMECSECGNVFPFVKGNYAIMVKDDAHGGVDPEAAVAILQGERRRGHV